MEAILIGLFHYGPWVFLGTIIVGMFTNWYGFFDKSYKGTWVTVKYDTFNEVFNNLQKEKSFMDHDGMTTPLEMKVIMYLGESEPSYEVKIPKHVFSNIEYNVILRELGIR